VAKDREQIMKELDALKSEVEELSKETPPGESHDSDADGVTALLRYMLEERERTNKKLDEMKEKIIALGNAVKSIYMSEQQPEQVQERMEVALSGIDTAVLDFIQSKGMACADDLMEFMKYRGRNGACARLNRLYMRGLLERHQLGHKVYYRYAGKATNTLIISPPQ
jgi:hypothetical protein